VFDARYIEVFRSNMLEMQKRSRPPPLMSGRPGPYDRPGMTAGRYGYSGRNRMKGQSVHCSADQSASQWHVKSLLNFSLNHEV